MTGTLAGALEARHIPAYNDSLEAEVEGDIEEGDDKVLLCINGAAGAAPAPPGAP